MGTRHLICVVENNEYKVAQYGQWDGYPEGQGVYILKFIRNENNLKKLKESLSKVRFIDNNKDREFLSDYNNNCPSRSNSHDNRTEGQKRWYNLYVSRDLGYSVLENLAYSEDNEILLENSINFAGNSLFCEYGYVIDFDKNVFEVYKGFNTEELSQLERFASIKVGKNEWGYKQIKHAYTFSLDKLPDNGTFLSVLESSDCEE